MRRRWSAWRNAASGVEPVEAIQLRQVVHDLGRLRHQTIHHARGAFRFAAIERRGRLEQTGTMLEDLRLQISPEPKLLRAQQRLELCQARAEVRIEH